MNKYTVARLAVDVLLPIVLNTESHKVNSAIVHYQFITLPSVVVEWPELEGREPSINTPQLLSRHPKTIREEQLFRR
jgi:hypothetical protein